MVAMTPVDDPQLTVYISVDEPSTGVYYGGQVASPLMKSYFHIYSHILSLQQVKQAIQFQRRSYP